MNIYVIAADFTGEPVKITDFDDLDQDLSDWGVGGALAFVYQNDVWVVVVDGPGEPRLFAGGDGRENWPIFSPDGNWLAYASNSQSSEYQIYVRPYPQGVPEYRVTADGGSHPTWSRGEAPLELFYRDPADTRKMMAVEIDTRDGFRVGDPQELFQFDASAYTPVRSYDVGPEGRFIMTKRWVPPPQPVTSLRVVFNWVDELERLVPTGR